MRLNPSHGSPRRRRKNPWLNDMVSMDAILGLPDISGAHASPAECLTHALALLEGTLARGRGNRDAFLSLRRDLPYVIHETSTPGTQILLNRQYKPLGCNLPDGFKWVRYEDYPHLHVQLTDAEISRVACPPYPRALFGDRSAPWLGRDEATAYLDRLRRLSELLTAAT